MCGISGFQVIKKSKSFDKKKKLIDITRIIQHRGPDDSGYWIDENKNVFIGHTRLSIIDLSRKGSQPMVSLNGRYVISFNGEIYNYKEIRSHLKKKLGIKFDNQTDTVVLLELISSYGLEKALSFIDGMFAFVLWDKKKKSLFLIRDRYGEKPLFFFIDENFVVFGSELKIIKRFFSPKKLDVDLKSSELYSCLGYIPAPNTIFKKTFKVMPSQLIEINNGKIVQEKIFWKSKEKNKNIEKFNQKDFEEEIEIFIEESVKKMMVADVEIGCFLSGGVDSSLIAALMQKNSLKKIKTYTVGFEEKAFDESDYAKKIANNLNSDHNELIVSMDDMLDNIDNISEIYDEPFGDSSCLPTELICRFASKSIKVVLSGDGGDEIFLGYNRYLFSENIEKFQRFFPRKALMLIQNLINKVPLGLLDKVSSPFQKKFGIHGFSHKIQKLSNILTFDNSSDFYKKLNVIDNDKLKSLKNSNLFSIDIDESMNLTESTQINDINYYLPNDILVKVDRASMFNSLEVRAPFLDHRLGEKLSNVSKDFKIQNNTLKFLLKKNLKKYIPEELFQRPKMGFAIPVEYWLNQKKVKTLFDDIFNQTDWGILGLDSSAMIDIWIKYKKYKFCTPTKVWNYAIAGLWVQNN